MMGWTKKTKKYRGFTLVELMIVIAIIAILAGILVVQWLGARTAAYDSEARTACRNAVLAAQLFFVDNGLSYSPDGVDMSWEDLVDIEPTLGEIELSTAEVEVGAAEDGQYGFDASRHVEGDWFQITIAHARGSKTFVGTPVGVYEAED